MSRTGIGSGEHVTADALRVSGLLTPARIRVPLRSHDKEGLLRELVDLVVDSLGIEAERSSVYRAVHERERVLSTGIGDGIAIPHAKHDAFTELVMAAGIPAQPVDFDALDGRPVQLLFLILGPESAAGSQVRLLSRLSRIMRDGGLRERLVAVADPEEFLQVLRSAEQAV